MDKAKQYLRKDFIHCYLFFKRRGFAKTKYTRVHINN